jgi:hypothetical protein
VDGAGGGCPDHPMSATNSRLSKYYWSTLLPFFYVNGVVAVQGQRLQFFLDIKVGEKHRIQFRQIIFDVYIEMNS